MITDFGVIEGFYWTKENAVNRVYKEFPLKDKIKLIRFIGKRGLNTYLYDPKLLRKGPKEIYERAFNPDLIGDEGLWREVLYEAKANGVKFIWGIAPGPYEPWHWGSFQGFGKPPLYLHSGWKNHVPEILSLVEKLLNLGVHQIALLFDDSPGTKSDHEIKKQAELVIIIEEKFPDSVYGLCPPKYSGEPEQLVIAHRIYDENLPIHIPIIITGPRVWCKSIKVEHLPHYPSGRKVVIWDNWMASDTSAPHRLTFNPPFNRENGIFREIRAFLINLCFPAERVIPVISGLSLLAYEVKNGIYNEDRFKKRCSTKEYLSRVAKDWAVYLETDSRIPECILSFKILREKCPPISKLEIENFIKLWPSLKPFVEESFKLIL